MSAQGGANVSKTNVAQPWVTSNALTENPAGVALNCECVDASIPELSLVNFNSMSSTNLAEFVDSASFVGPPLRGFGIQPDSLPRVARIFAVAHIRSTLG